MSQHTPGPWVMLDNSSSAAYVAAPRRLLDPQFRFGSGEEPDTLAQCRGDSEIRKANARLIAAAPDLLEALQAIIRDASPSDTDWVWPSRDVYEKAIAAISKATGGAG